MVAMGERYRKSSRYRRLVGIIRKVTGGRMSEQKEKYVVTDEENHWLHTSTEPETVKEAIQSATEAGDYDPSYHVHAFAVKGEFQVDCVPCFTGECCKGTNCDADCCNESTCNCNPDITGPRQG
jgi:hypothetical protein